MHARLVMHVGSCFFSPTIQNYTNSCYQRRWVFILFYIQLFLLTDVKLLTLSAGLKTFMGTKVPQVMTF